MRLENETEIFARGILKYILYLFARYLLFRFSHFTVVDDRKRDN